MLNLYIVYGFLLFVFLLNLFNYFKTYRRLIREENVLYTYLLLSIFGWFLCNAVADISDNEVLATTFARLGILFPAHILNAFFQITRIFPQTFKHSLKPITFSFVNIFVLLLTFGFILYLDTPLNISNLVVLSGEPIYYVPGFLYFLLLLVIIFFISMIIVSWSKNYRNYTKTQKRQILLFVIALCLVSFSGIVGLIFLPLQGIYEYGPTIFLSLSLLLFVTNQNLLVKGFMPNVLYDVGLLIWGIISAAILTFYIFVITGYDGDITTFSVFLLTLTLSIILLASYKKISTLLRQDYLGVEDEVLRFSKRTTIILDKEQIIEEIYETLKIVFPKAKCEITLERDNSSNLYEKLKKWWFSSGFPMITTQEIIIEQFVLKKVEEKLTKSLYSVFKEKNIDLVIPLNIGDRLGGVIVIKNLDSVLGIKEYEILSLLAENASVAISRAILYEEVEKFSKSLQIKVDEQTKELRARMESMEQMRQRERDLLDIMGHELRTPLTIARNSLDLMEMYKKKQKKKRKTVKWNSDFQKQFEYIKSAIRREMGIVETLLSATKLDAKKMETHITEVDLVKIVETTLLGFEQEALRKGLKVKVEMDLRKTWIVKADSLQLQQVLDNFVSNAVKYTQRGFVRISLKGEGNKVSITVSDSGEGISKADLKKLGTKFFRLNQYLPSNGKNASEGGLVRPGGTGLGLYVAFGLVELMGGSYNVKSEKGKGSTFTVVLEKSKLKDL